MLQQQKDGRNDDQSQKVTESPVEINFSLMKVIARTEQCAALEREVVLLSGILITNAIALAWAHPGRETGRKCQTICRRVFGRSERTTN